MEFNYENGIIGSNDGINCFNCLHKFIVRTKTVLLNFLQSQFGNRFCYYEINFRRMFEVKKKMFAGPKRTTFPPANSLRFLTRKHKREIVSFDKNIAHC